MFRFLVLQLLVILGIGQPANVKEDASTQGQPRPVTLPEESSAGGSPRTEGTASRVANFLTSFIRKKKTSPDPTPATQNGPVRPDLFLDSKGKIVAAHPRCAGFFGRQLDELGGLNIKDLIKPGFDQEVTNALAKGKEANDKSFHVLALRKDGSEFTTQFSFKLLQDFRFRWAVFVQAPAGGNGTAEHSAEEPKAIVPTTETATTETPTAVSDEKPPARPVGNKDIEAPDATRRRPEAENRNLNEFSAKARAELDKEREVIKLSRKKEEVFQTQVQTLQGALEQAEARAHDSAPQAKDWEKRAANLKKCVDELTRRHAAEQNAAIKAAQRIKELEEQLKRSGDEQTTGKKDIEGQGDTRHRLKTENRNLAAANAKARAELEKEREAVKVARKKEEELQTQVQNLKGALEQAEAGAHEGAPQAKDWEKKAVDLKKSVDELTRRHAAEQSAAVKAAQRVKELERQLKHAGGSQTAAKKDVADDDATRQRLEAEIRKVIEASDKAKAELEKERVANTLARKKEEEFNAQIQKLQGALEQAGARAHEGAPQAKDWEKKAADLKKSVDELTSRHAAEQNAAVKAAQRVKELEEQLKRAGNDQAVGKKDVKDEDATRQRLEAEIRKAIEASDKAKADLDKERLANKLAQKKEEEFNAQIQKLQGASEQAETRARESATQSKDWEKKADDLKKSVDELTSRHAAEQNAAVKAAERVKELEEQLKRAGSDQAVGKKDVKDEDATRQRLEAEIRKAIEASDKAKADLDKERLANKLAQKKEEEFNGQIQKLQGALEQAETRARESATQSKDWEKKADDLKKSVDELTSRHATEQSATVKAAERVKELEEQLKRAGDDQTAGKKNIESQDAARQRLEAEIRKAIEASDKAKADLDKERLANKLAQKKEEEFNGQIQKLQGALEQAETRARESATQSKDWEKKAADLKKSVDELTSRHAAEQNAAVKAAQRVKELEEQLKRAGDDQAAGKKNIKDQDATRQRLETENRDLTEANAKAKADLDKEREAIQVSRKKEEELQTQVQKLQGTLEQAEARARESATQSKDWEKKAADLKKSVDGLTSRHAAEQSAAIKAAQRVKELEEQLKRAGDDQAAGKKNIEDQNATRQRLETENHNLTEANAKARADLDKEREAIKVSRKKEEEFEAQIKKLQGTLEQAEARARESAVQSKDWEKKVDDLKKSVDELTKNHAAEQSAAAKRVTEIEQQLKRAGDDQVVGKKHLEDQDAARQRLETENRNLTEANAKAKAELEKEREAIKVSLKKEEELRAQVQNLQGAFEKAEAGARESAAKSKDWEKEAVGFKKSIDELTRIHAAEQSAAEKRVWNLEEQLKRAGDDLAAGKAENRDLTESAEKQAALEKKANELEERVRRHALSLAKADAELERQRADRERAEKSASSAAAHIEKLEEKLRRQVDFERASLRKIEDLERTLLDRGDDLARAYAALRIEVKERQAAERQSRLASEMGNPPESNKASSEGAKKASEESSYGKNERSYEKNERLEVIECSLTEAGPEDESRRVEELLSEARQQREKLSAEIFMKASCMYRDGLYSECLELTKELMQLLDEKIAIFNNAWNLHINTLVNLGRYEEAKTVVLERIKEIEERFGKKHPSLMSPLKNLAAILDRTGFVFEAEQAMRRVSSIAEKSPSVDDVEFGTYLNNLSKRAGMKRPNAL